MKKHVLIFSTFLMLFIFETTFAGTGARIKIQNNTGKTLYPAVLSATCMSYTGTTPPNSWPKRLEPLQNVSNYAYVETSCDSGELSLTMEGPNGTYPDIILRINPSWDGGKVEKAGGLPSNYVKDDGYDGDWGWDWVTVEINSTNAASGVSSPSK